MREKKQCFSHVHVCEIKQNNYPFHTGIHPKDDSSKEVSKYELHKSAIPTNFPAHPHHKQRKTPQSERALPKKRHLPFNEDGMEPPNKYTPCPSEILKEHQYSSSKLIEDQLKKTKQKLDEAKQELKGLKQKVKRRNKKISQLLQDVKDRDMLRQEQLDLLKMNFSEKTFTLIENELNAQETDSHALRYSDQLKQFAVTMHFYSPQAYEFLRSYLHLPHQATIRKWSSSMNCEPGFLSEVMSHLKDMVQQNELNKHCILMLDAMALKKEVVYDPKSGGYGGFVDCGNFQPSCRDSLATEALVFMVVGLTGHWKYPVAYFLADHLAGDVQAEIIKQLICVLTNAGLKVHGVTCDGSYANQYTSTKLGCTLIPGHIKPYFPHPADPDENVHFIFDACHLVKLVRNCIATMGTIYHDGEAISWSYIEKLDEIQQKDNLNLANKLKRKHILWQQHKMNVKIAVQALSSSVADAIDFLRIDLGLPEFAGSEKTTDFIRCVDKLFDLMNSKTPAAKGYKHPMNNTNFDNRKEWLNNCKTYIEELTDVQGQRLTMGRRKTAWVGFLVTIDSVLAICKCLLHGPQPFKYVLTFKMSQDHLEMFFSRVRRRGGWNNNPNCFQFKWSLRGILLKNSIMPSKNANVSMEEPVNTLFQRPTTAAELETSTHMQKFAQLLKEPSDFHDHVLHYMAGYVARHIIKDCKCTKCCMALHRNSSHPASPFHLLTTRKDRGGLIKPQDDVFKIVQKTDKILRYGMGITLKIVYVDYLGRLPFE